MHAADMYEEKSPVTSIVSLLPSTPHHIEPFTFPKFSGPVPPSMGGVPDGKRDIPVETKYCNLLGIKEKTPFSNLKVCMWTPMGGGGT